ncbi:glycosyltransferase [Anaeroselena agilis]|uniref:Glycosyltransferase n=1 Tax=Anaeroselena agilis TaxID=3063788 RepID=A0ABU3NV69_9FIRM|nr:glycosyltransferase [Selenomonadales bacterium 4137-cl]
MTSIIVLTYNKLDYTKLCLNSIRQHTEPATYEVIVVDNHSTDGTVTWLQSQPDLRLVLNDDNIGFPAGCNQGISVAIGDSVLLLNNDTVVTPNWLANLRSCLFSSGDIGAVGAVTNSCSNFQSIVCEYGSIEEMINFARRNNHSDPEHWEDRGRLVGYCMLIKTEVIKKVGLLDELFSPGNYEDDDYSLRIRKAGYRLVLCRDTFIHHFGSISFGEQTSQYNMLLETNKQKFISKWGFAPASIHPSNSIQDPGLKKWFAYQHDFNFHRQSMRKNRDDFYALLGRAEFSLLSGDREKALQAIMRAADLAHHSHPGFFACPKLESMLRTIGAAIALPAAVPQAASPESSAGKRKVLHVISQGYNSCGHTKTLERWMALDIGSVHSVLVTLNSATNPPWLAAAAIQSGGWYQALDKAGLSLCQRAKLLRDTANRWADAVVLHIHPHDPVAPAAFGLAGGPPVVFVNHAHLAFSLGMTAADLVVDHWGAGQSLTRARRNIPHGRRLPLPLGTPRAQADKQVAKSTLGIRDEQVVCLTIAQPYQVVACGEYNLANLVRELSGRFENLTMLVVGPLQAAEWARLNGDSGGRIKVVDTPGDFLLYHSAADIYLDAIPLGSPSEALEAGALGIPVVGLATEIAEQLSGDIAPDGPQTHFHDKEELFAVFDRLVADPVYRQSRSQCLQAAILHHHCAGWPAQLEQLYPLLPAAHVPLPLAAADNEKTPSDWQDIVLVYFQQQSGLRNCRFG